MIETTALGAAGLAGIAGGVWSDAAEFIGTRQFTRFTPAMAKERADELKAGWQRATRAALSWARDPGELAVVKKPRGKKRAGAATKKAPAKKKDGAKTKVAARGAGSAARKGGASAKGKGGQAK
jgi:hypothetical protein